MPIDPIGPPSQSNAATSRARLAEDFDNFLVLLTTQLQHQDPLSPMDSSDFIQQLVSFTSVEQALKTNANLEALIGLERASRAAAAVGYLGTTIVAEGETTMLTNDRAIWVYTLPQTAATTTVLINDAEGAVVFTAPGATAAGTYNFVWDGRDSNGNRLPDGLYTITVVAEDANGVAIPATTVISGIVSAVDTIDDGLVLVVGGVNVPLEAVISVSYGIV